MEPTPGMYVFVKPLVWNNNSEQFLFYLCGIISEIEDDMRWERFLDFRNRIAAISALGMYA